MKEELKNNNEEKVVAKPEIKPIGDIDDFIFGEEVYRCSER